MASRDSTELSGEQAVAIVIAFLAFCYWVIKKIASSFTGGSDALNLINAKKLEEEALKDIEKFQLSNISADLIRIERHHGQWTKGRRSIAIAVVAVFMGLCAASPSIIFGGENANYYHRLGVSRNAATSEAKRAYRKMSVKMHPDKVAESMKAEATVKFQKIADAYEALNSERKRTIYERHGKDGIKCFNDKACSSREYAYWTNDLPALCAFYLIFAVIAGFFTTLKGAPASGQMFVYGGYMVTLALELLLRGAHEEGQPAKFDLPLGTELTRYEKACTLRLCFVWWLFTSMIVGFLLNDTASEADISRSYFNAMLLQQTKMTEAMKEQAEVIQALQARVDGRESPSKRK